MTNLWLCVCVPSQHKISIGIVGSRSSGTPFDCVNLFAVGLQIMNAGVLLHTPKLEKHQKQNKK